MRHNITLKFVLSILLFTFVAEAAPKNYEVTYRGRDNFYEVKLSRTRVSIESKVLTTVLEARPCSQRMLDNFNSGLRKQLKVIVETDKKEQFVETTINGKKRRLEKGSSLEIFFHNLPRLILNMKRKESLVCSQ